MRILIALLAVLVFAQAAEANKSEVMLGQWTMEYTINSSFANVYNLDVVSEESTSEGETFITGTGEYDDPVAGAYFPSIESFVLIDPGTVIDRVFVIVFEDNRRIGCVYLHYSYVDQAWSDIYDLNYQLGRLPEYPPEPYVGGDDVVQVLKQRIAVLEDTMWEGNRKDTFFMGVEIDGTDYVSVNFRVDYDPMTERELFNGIAADWLLGDWLYVLTEFYEELGFPAVAD